MHSIAIFVVLVSISCVSKICGASEYNEGPTSKMMSSASGAVGNVIDTILGLKEREDVTPSEDLGRNAMHSSRDEQVNRDSSLQDLHSEFHVGPTVIDTVEDAGSQREHDEPEDTEPHNNFDKEKWSFSKEGDDYIDLTGGNTSYDQKYLSRGPPEKEEPPQRKRDNINSDSQKKKDDDEKIENKKKTPTSLASAGKSSSVIGRINDRENVSSVLNTQTDKSINYLIPLMANKRQDNNRGTSPNRENKTVSNRNSLVRAQRSPRRNHDKPHVIHQKIEPRTHSSDNNSLSGDDSAVARQHLSGRPESPNEKNSPHDSKSDRKDFEKANTRLATRRLGENGDSEKDHSGSTENQTSPRKSNGPELSSHRRMEENNGKSTRESNFSSLPDTDNKRISRVSSRSSQYSVDYEADDEISQGSSEEFNQDGKAHLNTRQRGDIGRNDAEGVRRQQEGSPLHLRSRRETPMKFTGDQDSLTTLTVQDCTGSRHMRVSLPKIPDCNSFKSKKAETFAQVNGKIMVPDPDVWYIEVASCRRHVVPVKTMTGIFNQYTLQERSPMFRDGRDGCDTEIEDFIKSKKQKETKDTTPSDPYTWPSDYMRTIYSSFPAYKFQYEKIQIDHETRTLILPGSEVICHVSNGRCGNDGDDPAFMVWNPFDFARRHPESNKGMIEKYQGKLTLKSPDKDGEVEVVSEGDSPGLYYLKGKSIVEIENYKCFSSEEGPSICLKEEQIQEKRVADLLEGKREEGEEVGAGPGLNLVSSELNDKMADNYNALLRMICIEHKKVRALIKVTAKIDSDAAIRMLLGRQNVAGFISGRTVYYKVCTPVELVSWKQITTEEGLCRKHIEGEDKEGHQVYFDPSSLKTKENLGSEIDCPRAPFWGELTSDGKQVVNVLNSDDNGEVPISDGYFSEMHSSPGKFGHGLYSSRAVFWKQAKKVSLARSLEDKSENKAEDIRRKMESAISSTRSLLSSLPSWALGAIAVALSIGGLIILMFVLNMLISACRVCRSWSEPAVRERRRQPLI